jgi:hypothetical protein
MWIALRIGVLYAAPVIAVLGALAYFAVLWRRVRRGELPRARAVRKFAWMLLLPVDVVLVVWATGEVASYFAVGGDQYAFDSAASAHFLWSLAPLAGYVFVPIAVLFAALSTLAGPRR